jgi:hypothetical protein
MKNKPSGNPAWNENCFAWQIFITHHIIDDSRKISFFGGRSAEPERPGEFVKKSPKMWPNPFVFFVKINA